MADLFDPPLPRTPGESCYWTGLAGSADCLALCNGARKADAPLLLVCVDNETVERTVRELRYFGAGDQDLPVFSLPDRETLPWDNFSPHQDIVSERLSALYHLPNLERGVLVVSMPSLMHRLPPQRHIVANSLDLAIGKGLDLERMRGRLTMAGYQSVESVHEHGEFAVRGSIFDVFPMGSLTPFRIELLGDEIETLRVFDPETQRSERQVEAIRLLPGREYPLDEQGIAAFRGRFQERFDVDLRQCPLYQDVSDGIDSPGLEYYLALFFERLDSLFDFLPENTIVYPQEGIAQAGERFWQDVEARYRELQIDRYRPILEPDGVFLRSGEILSRLCNYRTIEIREHARAVDFGALPLPDLNANAQPRKPLAALRQFLEERDGRVLFCAESAGRRETLLETLGNVGVHPVSYPRWEQFLAAGERLGICVAPLDRGMVLPALNLALLTEARLFGNRIAQRRRRARNRVDTELIVRSLTELRIGDAVVHADHGIGLYRGLQTLATDGHATEFLTLEYANGDKLYVPVASLHLINRYSGVDREAVSLNRLGTDHWQRTKRKAAEKILDVATELLDIHARRQARKGFACKLRLDEYENFAAAFPFEETPDQASAIKAVSADMQSERAMDRLICGDVGFGKTEVAMRAAFIAVHNNKQVALLAPTTLLAQQHFDTFRDRFADWPVVVEVISRFKSAAHQKKTLQRVVDGEIDILVGTHKLLHAELDYDNLGLLIIDEEHRFGVRQKEKLKSLRANVDILALTATPIPRTLNMALAGMRDLSLIVTPPARRLSVKTFIRGRQDSLIKEAVSRELLRGGQVFYLHNEIESIDRAADHLREIVPQGRIGIAHGKMPERELEQVMADFYHKRYNVLVCTTIIETGIDVPAANTILINRADRFGLAQLHQLRGRVGRSHHQAYAWLLLPDHRLSGDAQKRIEAVQAASTLGAGFTLASHDLEIRGAGELLGEEQSGHIQKTGFSLYMEMLEEAVNAIRSGRTPAASLEPDRSVDVELRIPALIPEDYLPDVHTRLIMYKRLSSCHGAADLEDLQVEMIDRFGLLPAPLKRLFRLTALKLKARSLGIRKIDANAATGRISFAARTPVDPLSLVQLVQGDPGRYRLGSGDRFHFRHGCEEADARLDYLAGLLDKFRLLERKAA